MNPKNLIVILVLSTLGIYHAGIGAWAFFFPASFYETYILHTGPFNLHLIQDAGAAFLAASIALMMAVFIRRWRIPCLVCAGLFLGIHASIHINEMIKGGMESHLMHRDLIAVIMPALLVWILVCVEKLKLGFLVES